MPRPRRERLSAARDDPQRWRQALRVVFALLGLLLVALVAGGLLVARDLNRSATHRYVDQLMPQRDASADLLLQLVNEETAVRGFVITRRAASLAPFAPAQRLAAADLATLERFAARDAALRDLVARAAGQRAGLDGYFAREISLVRAGVRGVAKASSRIEAGKALFDRFRATSAAMAALELVRTGQAEAQQNSYYDRLVLVIGLSGGGALLIVVALGWIVPRRTYWLLRTQQRDAARARDSRNIAQALQSLTSELAVADGVAAVHAALSLDALSLLGAAVLAVGVVVPERGVIEVWETRDPLDGRPAAFELPLDDPGPEAAAVREGSGPRYLRSDPTAVPARARAEESVSEAILPLGSEGDGRRGFLAARYPREQAFDEGQQTLLRTVATLVDQALRRAESHDRLIHTATILQRALLPAGLPSTPGAVFEMRYEAAGVGTEVGGDWYDAVELPGRRVAASVGDVAGKGVVAAALMGRLRHSYRAYALEGHLPAAILSRLARHMREQDMATVLCLDLDLEARLLRYSGAGHLPAILLDTATRKSTLLDRIDAPPLGVDSPHGFSDVVVHVPECALILAYTDGLVERRGVSLDERIAKLRRELEQAPLEPLNELLDAVLGAMREGGQPLDDMAVLAIELGPIRPAV